jgi:hypothetical protein
MSLKENKEQKPHDKDKNNVEVHLNAKDNTVKSDSEPPPKMQLTLDFFQKLRNNKNLSDDPDPTLLEILEEFDDVVFELGFE